MFMIYIHGLLNRALTTLKEFALEIIEIITKLPQKEKKNNKGFNIKEAIFTVNFVTMYIVKHVTTVMCYFR